MAQQEGGDQRRGQVSRNVGSRDKVGDAQDDLLAAETVGGHALGHLAPGGGHGLALEDGDGPRDLPDDPAEAEHGPQDVGVGLVQALGQAEQSPDDARLDEGAVEHVDELPDDGP
jgi:hypothetical protein